MEKLAQLAADLGPALMPVGQIDLLQSIVNAAAKVFRAGGCSVALLDDARQEVVFQVASSGPGEKIVGVRVPVGHGLAGWVVGSGQPVVVDEVGRDPRFAREVAEAVGYMPTSIVALPVETEREVLGVLEILDPEPGSWDMELMGVFAYQVALAVEGSRVFGDLGRTLFQAVGAMTSDSDLVDALGRVARNAPPPRAELAGLAVLFAELGQVSHDEQAAATRLLAEFTSYVRSRNERQ